MFSDRRKGTLLTVAGAFFAAAYLIPYKAGAAAVGPEGMVLPLMLSAAVLNSFFLGTVKGGGKRRLDRTSLGVALVLGALSALGNESVAHALQSITPGLASVVLRTQVVFVVILGWWLLKERVTGRFWLGVLVALAGFATLRGKSAGTDAGASVAGGLAWALLAAASFAWMQVVIRKKIAQFDPYLVNGLRLWIAAGLLACVPGRIEILFGIDWRIWALAAGAALVGPVISRILLMFALRHMTAALSTLILFVSPVFAFALGGIFLATWPDGWELLGSAVILFGVVLPVAEKNKDHGSRFGQF